MLSRRTFGRLSAAAVFSTALSPARAASAPPKVKTLKITILSTMLAEDYETFGEWGFAALVEVDGKRMLFDSGAHPETVLKNCQALKIDLAGIDEMVLSHNHGDHSGGIVALRTDLMKSDPKALSIAHVGKGIFIPRVNKQGKDENGALPIRAAYENLGGKWVEHDKPTELLPGVWLTGPVPRPNDEHNWSGYRQLVDEKTGQPGPEDVVQEDSALIFDTEKGLVMLTGCGHAGVVNIAQYARATVREAPFEAIVGGLHLFRAKDETIAWTVSKLKPMGVRHLLAAHCTGIEATYKLREGLGLDRKTATVAAVGSWYDLAEGVHAGELAG
ncbi:MAG TPA: MBL fold metallo-hydrolase [Magnetospirillaceae bacterium]|nr:MBL fold metallo-hydrolase [Magnetospirillaceae bacterium]